MMSLIDEIARGREGRNWGFSLGLPKLEDLTDGLTKSTYTLLFASSGIGKSSLAIYAYIYKPLMEHLEDDNLLLILFSLEMKKIFIMAKLLSIYIHEMYNIDLSMKELLSRKKGYRLSDENMKIVEECIPWLEKVNKVLHVYDGSLNSTKMYAILLEELESVGKFTKENHTGYIPNNPNKVVLAVLDHAGLLQAANGRSKKDEIDMASHMIVSLRNRTDISMLWLMQSNRAVAGMDRKKQGFNEPMIEDLR